MKKINKYKKLKQLIWSKKVLGSIVVVGALVSAGVFGLSGYFGGGEQGVPEDTWTRGLVAAYNFDEGSGQTLYNAADTGSVNDGTLGSSASADSADPTWINRGRTADSSSGPTPVGSAGGGALEFDGTDDYVDCGNDSSLDITGAITVEAWVKTDTVALEYQIIVDKRTPGVNNDVSYSLYMSYDDIIYGGFSGGAWKSVTINNEITVGNYYHIVGVNDGSNMKIYLDAVETIGDATGSMDSNSGNMEIGRRNWNPNYNYFNGAIDEVKIYNRALSAEEIRYHYNRGGPVAHWSFDEGAGVNVYNQLSMITDNQYDGSIKSSALDFDGGDDYVNCGSDTSLNITSTITIEAWVKLNTLPPGGTQDMIIFKQAGDWIGGAGYSLASEDGSALTMFLAHANDDYTRPSVYGVFSSGVWTYVVGTYDGNNIRLYKNGNYVGGEGWNKTIGITSKVLEIGTSAGYESIDGTIDEVRIYNKALHATTIANHYKGDYTTYEKTAGGADLTDDDLVLYIPFDDAAGDTATNYGDCGGTAANCNGGLSGYTTAEQVAKYGDTHDTGWVIDTDFTKARHNTGLDFGGVNGFFQSDSYIPSASSTSYSLWFKPSDGAYSANEYLFSQGNDDPSAYILATTGNIKVMAEDGVLITSATTVLDTKWHHIETTADGTNMRLYIDGVLDGTAAYTGSSDDAGISAGAHISRSGFFNGIIDDLKVYAYARSPGEIRLDYNAGFAARMGPAGMTCSEDPASCMDYGLVASYDFDEGDGQTLYNAADTGSANDGTLGSSSSADSADPTWIASEGGSRASASGGGPTSAAAGGTALSFDGSNDYVNCGNDPSLNITDAITIEAWVKADDWQGANAAIILAKCESNQADAAEEVQWRLRAYNNKLNFRVFDDDYSNRLGRTYDTELSINQWYHVVATYDGSTDESGLKIYLDGTRVDDTSDSLGTFVAISSYPTLPVMISRLSDTDAQFFNGSIDNVKIYNRALSAEEVRYHYNRGDPVAHWRFDEGEGSTAYDESTNNNDGTLHLGSLGNTATSSAWVTGKHSSAIDFDGEDDYVDCGSGSSLDITDAITIEAWVKYNSTNSTHQEILCQDDSTNRNFEFLITDADKPMLSVYKSGSPINGYDSTALTDGVWYHLVGIFDGTQVMLYKNGVLGDNVNNVAAPIDSDPVNTSIGQRITVNDRNFNGTIDDVRIYDYARTPAQIQMDYNDGLAVHLGGSQTSTGSLTSTAACSTDPASCMDHGLVASYDFDEGDGQTLYNAADTGSANDGTLGSSSSADSADPTWINRDRTAGASSVPIPVSSAGGALDFDGTNDYVDCGGDASIIAQTQGTVEFWVKPASAAEQGVISGSKTTGGGENDYCCFQVISGSFRIEHIADRVTMGSITLNTWYHVVWTSNGTQWKGYINGEEQSLTITLGSNNGDWFGDVSDIDKLTIGNLERTADSVTHFNGSIDGVKIYNRALSAEEVRYHYNRGAPVAHWRMDEGEGSTAYDESSNNNDGTLDLGSLGNTATSSAWVTGKHGSAIDFDGEDDYVDCGSDSALDITDAITVSAWVKPNNIVSLQAIYEKYNLCFRLYLENGKFAFYIFEDGMSETHPTSITLPQIGNWYHVVGTHNSTLGSSNTKIYLNGVLEDTHDFPYDIMSVSSRHFELGRYGGSNNRYFNGTIDDVRIYNYARTPAQILMDYNAGFGAHLK